MEYQKIERPRNLVTEVFSQMQDKIISGEMVEGEKLPSENQLCKDFNVSRVVIRETLQNLRATKLIITFQGKGSFVSNPANFIMDVNSSTAEELVNISKKITVGELKEYFEFRESIECYLFKNFTGKKDQIDFTKADKALEEMEKNYGNVAKYTESDYNFHLSILEATNKKLFIQSYKSCKPYIMHILLGLNAIPSSGEWGVNTHRNILDLLKTGNAQKAIDLLKLNDNYNIARISTLKK
ncbi:MAG: FadR family transcriptional regulator [Spirochaetaceae bacterium]|nr:FadR family transcriptional regulator [Spirochaetaceae bacterium]